MAVTPYEDILKKQREAQQEALDTQNTAIHGQYDAAGTAIRDTYGQQMKEAQQAYNDQYGVNAIQQKINENAIAEANANLGLTNSGMNTMQQTATILARGNADRAVAENKQKAVDALAQKMASLLAENETGRQSALAGTKAEWEQNVAATAADMYNTQVESDAKVQTAAIEAAIEAAAKPAEESAFKKATFSRENKDGDHVFYIDGKEVVRAPGANPYTGEMNSDLRAIMSESVVDESTGEKATKDLSQYTFGNGGYQPNFVLRRDASGAPVKKNGKLVTDKLKKDAVWTINVNGVEQSVWYTTDDKGRKHAMYYWDGTKNRYIETTDEELEEIATREG